MSTRIIHRLADSPIETKLFYEICEIARWRAHPMESMTIAEMKSMWLCEGDIVVAPQCRVGRYKLDIGLCAKGPADRRIIVAVECDGWAYHSSPEQKLRDSVRDKRLVELGVDYIHRFTGSEIHNRLGACAFTALDEIRTMQKWPKVHVGEDDNGEWWDLEADKIIHD